MRDGFPTLVVSVVVATLLAGCSGDGSTTADTDEPAQTDDGVLGSVSGLVLDDDFQVVSGVAIVVADAQNVSTVSGTDGTFHLMNVPPGPHSLVASKIGYVSATVPFQLAAGEHRTNLEIRLQAIASPEEGYVEVTPGEAFISCSATTALQPLTFTQVCGADENNEPVFTFTVNASQGLIAVMVEMEWTPASGITAQELRTGLWKNPTCEETRCDAEDNKVYNHHTGESYVQGTSPLQWWNGTLEDPFTDDLNTKTETTLGAPALVKQPAPVDQNPLDYSIVLQQPVTFWISEFYHTGIAPGYTALGGT